MATSTSSLPLPEITTDDFERSWTRFHLVAAASKWDDEKKLLMLPALLRGKLVEIFISLSAEEKETLTKLKQALSDRAGITRDSLTSAKAFSERKQGAYESVRDYEIDLTRLFKEAYPNEDTTKSAVLLQGFLGGFRPEITRHILLKGTPNKPEDALKEALAVERALAFQGSEKHETPVQWFVSRPIIGFRYGYVGIATRIRYIASVTQAMGNRFFWKRSNNLRIAYVYASDTYPYT
eukprot:Em0001g1876a